MTDQRNWIRRLEDYLREELEAQARLDALLLEQERALTRAEGSELAERSRAVERELARSTGPAAMRKELIAELASHWEVEAGALTLSSVIERLGAPAEHLAPLRKELRSATARVFRRARRIAAAARYHQRLSSEILEAVFAAVEVETTPDGGILVDAEA